MEGAVVGGLIAEEQCELAFLVFHWQIVGHGDVLEALSALAEPVVLGHFLDEQGFGDGGWLVLGAEAAEEGVEFVLILRGKDGEGAGEAVAGGFPGFGFGSGAVLRVFLVRADLGFGGHRDCSWS